MNIDNIISTGIKTIQLQAKSISDLQVFINEDFKCTVELIVKSEGRLVVTGIGKSAIIAQKIVATLNITYVELWIAKKNPVILWPKQYKPRPEKQESQTE